MKLTEAASHPQLRRGSKLPSVTDRGFAAWVKNWDEEYNLKPIEVK